MRRSLTCLRFLATCALAMLLCVSLVRAYAEEPLTFLDPYTGEPSDEEISTIHNDLTYVLALAAGFSREDSITLQIWDQLVDSEELGPGTVVSYTNCAGAFYPAPDPSTLCRWGERAPVAWPLWGQMKDPAHCVTSRFGPYSPFFHFPRQNAQELGALHDWGWGLTDTLVGYESYAWGARSVLEAPCAYTHTVVITTGLVAGSLPAFATYLHSLADSYSHLACIQAMDALGAPWPTHSLTGVPECDYNPARPTNDDAHGREFGTAYMTDSLRTDAAILAVYGELVARSLRREGRNYPLGLDAPLAGVSGAATLRQALYNFVHQWQYDQPAGRRSYAGEIARAVLAQSQPRRDLYVPLICQ